MDVTIIEGDDDQPSEPLWTRLKRTEKELAEAEGREPEGWYFIEGMNGPQPIDFTEEEK